MVASEGGAYRHQRFASGARNVAVTLRDAALSLRLKDYATFHGTLRHELTQDCNPCIV